MLDTLRQLLPEIRSGKPVAYCRLVETRGSTPQKAGALMLIRADGTQLGTLGGGCVEAEVKLRALEALQAQRPGIHAFSLTSDFGWDDGLICGGRMQVLIYPIPIAPTYFERLAKAVDSGVGITEAIAFDANRMGLPVPSLFLFDVQGDVIAQTDLFPPEAIEPIGQGLRPLGSRPRPYVGSGIAYLPVLPRCRLLIVGGGHVGQAVANLASDLDFDVTVVDDREEFVTSDRFPRAQRRESGDIQRILNEMEISPETYCIIVTRGHHHDEKALACVVERGAAYVGMIGSRRKIRLILDDLLAMGKSREALQQVYAPIGIEIGSQTVPEIALSICAELVAHRNNGGVVPGRPDRVEFEA